MLLQANDDQICPGVVVCVGHVPRVVQVPGRYGHKDLVWRGAHVMTARVENGAMTRRHARFCRTTDEYWGFLDYARRRDRPLWLIAVDLSRLLTVSGFWSLLEAGEFHLTRRSRAGGMRLGAPRTVRGDRRPRPGLLCTQDPPTIVQSWNSRGWQMLALDLRNYLDLEWPALADIAGIGPVSADLESLTDEQVESECVRRAEITSACVSRIVALHHEEELGRFAYTGAGMAMAAFRHRYMRLQPNIPDLQWQRDYERCASYPGRVEAYWVGHQGSDQPAFDVPATPEPDVLHQHPRGPYYLLDASSMYGHTMRYTRVPVSTVEHRDSEADGTIPIAEIGYDCLAHVTICTDDDTYPVRCSRGLVWSRGTYDTYLCGPELLRAVSSGHVRHVNSYIRYDLGWLFRDYSIGVWQAVERCAASADPVGVHLCKSMLSRLAGKFAQRREDWRPVPDRIADQPWHQWCEVSSTDQSVTHYRSIGWDVYMLDRGRDAAHCWPALNAYVCAAARERLRGWMLVAGARHVLHVATDALLVDQDGYQNLCDAGCVQPGRMGYLRVVEESDRVTIAGPSHYCIGGHLVCAGAALAGRMVGSDRYRSTRETRLKQLLWLGRVSTVRQIDSVERIPERPATGVIGPGGWILPATMPVDVSQIPCRTMRELILRSRDRTRDPESGAWARK